MDPHLKLKQVADPETAVEKEVDLLQLNLAAARKLCATAVPKLCRYGLYALFFFGSYLGAFLLGQKYHECEECPIVDKCAEDALTPKYNFTGY